MSDQSETSLTTWNDEADIVVVGFGGAGAVAAIEARERGCDVLVLDRFHGGGATAISGGVFYGGGGTHIQREADVEDTVEDMRKYLEMELKGIVGGDTLRDFCETSSDNLIWLEGHGVPFEASLCPVKTSYPTDDYFLYYSGNESFRPFRDQAKPAARGHRAKGRGLPGASFYEPLRESALRVGARVQYETLVQKLIQDSEGRVAGVECLQIPEGTNAAKKHRKLNERALKWKNYAPALSKKWWTTCEKLEQQFGIRRRIRAKRGVILSTGGFIYNREMVSEHAPKYRPGMPLGTWGDKGHGIQMGLDVGGHTENMNRVSAWRFINPPLAWTNGIIVNKDGKRYVNESLYGAAIGEAMVEENGGKAYLIIDRTLFKKSRSQVMWGRAQWFQAAPALLNLYFGAKKGRTIEELAAKLGVPSVSLRETYDSYREQVREGADDPFLKDEKYYYSLDDAPFYAIDCSIDSQHFPCPTLTLGGLAVNEETGGVKSGDEGTIEGLYAAGRTAVGICSRQYVSGLSIADCVYSGRRAARAAAERTAADTSA